MYDYLITDPDRATEIAIVATELQDASVQRLDAAEDKTDHQEHRRQVESAMFNVYSDSQIGAFVEAGLKFQEEMQLFCLQ